MNLMKNKISKERGESVKRVKINNQLLIVNNSLDISSEKNGSPAIIKEDKISAKPSFAAQLIG